MSTNPTPDQMQGAILPGNSTTKLECFPVPKPGHGEVLIRMKASTICGSDIRCIYHEHLGKGPEGYQPGMIAGHEPAGQIVEVGPGCREFQAPMTASSFITSRAAASATIAVAGT